MNPLLYVICFSDRGICFSPSGSEREEMTQFASAHCVIAKNKTNYSESKRGLLKSVPVF